jgi:hypothetical protein
MLRLAYDLACAQSATLHISVRARPGLGVSGVYRGAATPAMVGTKHASNVLKDRRTRFSMRLAAISALAVATLLGTVLVSDPADAQRRRVVQGDRSERITFVDETGRARTRITVRPRSYLDAGTEVSRYERPDFRSYAEPPGYTSFDVVRHDYRLHRGPLPGPYELPGFQPGF